MLLLFFGLVLICAFFFAIGFAFGKKTMAIPSPGTAGTNAGTPAAVVRPSAAKNTQPVSPNADLSFYKSVEQRTADTSLTQPSAGAAADTAKSQTAAANVPAGAYYVQVAAVTRQEDADALVDALKKKQYPAFALASSSNDKFIRVQVGPYTELKDAEATRSRLVADGYNPIVKK
jgi:DedD protein